MATNAVIALIVGVPALVCTIAIVIGDARRSGLRPSVVVGTASLAGTTTSNPPSAAVAGAAPPSEAISVARSTLPELSPVVALEATAEPNLQVKAVALAEPEPNRAAAEPAPGNDATERRPESISTYAPVTDTEPGADAMSVGELLAQQPAGDTERAPDIEPEAEIRVGAPGRSEPTSGPSGARPPYPAGVALPRPRRIQGRKLLVAAGVGAALAVALARW